MRHQVPGARAGVRVLTIRGYVVRTYRTKAESRNPFRLLHWNRMLEALWGMAKKKNPAPYISGNAHCDEKRNEAPLQPAHHSSPACSLPPAVA